MSYLNLSSINMANFQKGTISLWFRFSKDSVDKAKAYNGGAKFHPEAPDIFKSTIPLVTFGRKVMAKVYESKSKTFTQEVPGGTLTHTVPQLVFVGEAPCEPSYIGIDCSGDEPSLIMRFQTATRAQVQGLSIQTIDIHWELNESENSYDMYSVVEDISYVQTALPESFLINPKFKVDMDKWHHLLVSFDCSGSVDVVAAEVGEDFGGDETETRNLTIKSWSKIWYAFDDENKKGKDNVGRVVVGQPTRGWVPQDENGIIPENAESAAFVFILAPPDPFVTGGGESPEYHWAASPIPMDGGPVGLPASAEYVETVYLCEMAELQFFGGIAFDTANETVRRAFIDGDGNPVRPNQKSSKADEGPMRGPGSIEFLDRKPDILLHGSSNWIKGKNTGQTGVDEKGNTKPNGQFKPTAKVEKYVPDPSLHGPQADKQKAETQ